MSFWNFLFGANLQEKELRYELLSSVLTKREVSFFNTLAPIAEAQGLRVLIKIRLADFIKPKSNQFQKGSNFYTELNKISRKHVDFLLCDADFIPKLAIEVQDSTHNEKNRKERDDMVRNIYNRIGLPFMEVWKWNNAEEIAKIITDKLSETPTTEIAPPSKPSPGGCFPILILFCIIFLSSISLFVFAL
jgi:hypothetical protein